VFGKSWGAAWTEETNKPKLPKTTPKVVKDVSLWVREERGIGKNRI
jgi:hypothetical protein